MFEGMLIVNHNRPIGQRIGFILKLGDENFFMEAGTAIVHYWVDGVLRVENCSELQRAF